MTIKNKPSKNKASLSKKLVYTSALLIGLSAFSISQAGQFTGPLHDIINDAATDVHKATNRVARWGHQVLDNIDDANDHSYAVPHHPQVNQIINAINDFVDDVQDRIQNFIERVTDSVSRTFTRFRQSAIRSIHRFTAYFRN